MRPILSDIVDTEVRGEPPREIGTAVYVFAELRCGQNFGTFCDRLKGVNRAEDPLCLKLWFYPEGKITIRNEILLRGA
ncbi:hypothetical protein NDU88_001303 [Pleurodeles waltl]|uniref:Uncharacterized protein n=1 Tax=Pleurodeles waltl TaxID=8319 RepID=A0AAV7NED6_PLEWA|nr:hypothetical protein NDU88_001303 [Pleurodeles waltl]